jgi:lipopolysaccharide biosynthesis regulator YciM
VRKLARASGRNMNSMIAHFYCELAEQDVARNNYSSARDRLKLALAADDKCVRASILLGDVDALEGNNLRAIEKQDIHYLGEVAERIAEAFRKLGDEQGLYDYFHVALQRHGGVSLALTFADVISSREGVEAAEKFIIEWLRRTPNVHGLHKLLELNLVKAKDSARNDLMMLKGIIEELRTQHLGYACGECGFKGKSLHWLCPGCNHWNTIKPVQEE